MNRELSIVLQIQNLESVSEEDLSKLRREELAKEINPSGGAAGTCGPVSHQCRSRRAILTYHPLILDERSVSLLLREVLARTTRVPGMVETHSSLRVAPSGRT